MLSKQFVSFITLSILFGAEQVLGRPVVQRTTSNVGDFGSCSIPQIKFGTGFDERRETAFEPVDQSASSIALTLAYVLIVVSLPSSIV